MHKMLPYVARAEHPGITLLDFLEEKGLSQRKFAELIGKTPIEINYVVKGSRPITTDLAIRLGIFFDTGPEVWLGLQRDFDVYSLRKKQELENIYNNILNVRSNFFTA